MNYEVRQFATGTWVVNLVSSDGKRGMTHFEDSGDAVKSPVITLFDGVKYNVNGTWAAVTTPGRARAVYLVRGTTMQDVNTQTAAMLFANGRFGSVLAVEYTGTAVATHTCSAIAQGRVISRIGRSQTAIGRGHEAEVEFVFDRLNYWN